MDGTLTLIFTKSETTRDIMKKISAFLQLRTKLFSPNFEGVSQKKGQPCPFDFLNCFGRKCNSMAPKAFTFTTKRVPLEANNW